MKDMKIHDWLNLVAAVSVVAGLALVTVELKQNNELALAEAIRESWYADNEIDVFVFENGILPLVKKSVENPLELTVEEIDKLDMYLMMEMQHQISVAWMSDRFGPGVFATIDAQAETIIGDFLYGRFARGWFDANEFWLTQYHPELFMVVKKKLATTPAKNKYTWTSEIRESVKRAVENE